MRLIAPCVAVVALLLSACSEPVPPADRQAAATAGPSARLQAVVEDYYDRYLELNPLVATGNGDGRFNDRLPNSLSEQWLADWLALEQEALAAITALDIAALPEADRLTAEQFRYGRELAITGFRFPEELLPFNQFTSLPVFFGQMGTGTGIHPFATTRDYEDFLARMRGFVVWADQAIANMREGIQQGVVQPRVLMERTLPQLRAFLVDDPSASLFMTPVREFPDGVPPADRARLLADYTRTVREDLLPAYRRLHDFVANEYLPATRTTIAVTELPNGEAWYAYLVKLHTTTTLSPEQIHELGLAEVRRIRAEMESVRARTGFTGDLPAFFTFLRTDPRFRFTSPEALVEHYVSLRERVEGALPKLFAVVPSTPFEVRPVEAFRAPAEAAASYQPGTPDGSRPGIFYVNTYDLPSRPAYMAESLFLHEAVPGHHFQISLQQALVSLPRFRRFGGDTAYVEGWGLYAESLGRELGLYADPYQYFGALTAEMWRAVRLVVDTGMHARGWTREQAIAYMRDNTALGETDIVAEVERYIAWPAQALSYKVGQLRIRELRERAARELRGRFDVREFHAQVLMDGPLALDVLQAKIERWIGSEAASAQGPGDSPRKPAP